MHHTPNQSHSEKVAMYSKLPKEELVEKLIDAENALDNIGKVLLFEQPSRDEVFKSYREYA